MKKALLILVVVFSCLSSKAHAAEFKGLRDIAMIGAGVLSITLITAVIVSAVSDEDKNETGKMAAAPTPVMPLVQEPPLVPLKLDYSLR